MIRFFSQKRKNVLKEGIMSKYFKYAIGEIILVVIGILIALQINNWNEARKQNNTLTSVYLIIKEDLQDDIITLKDFIKDYEDRRKPAFNAIQSKNKTREILLKNPVFVKSLLGFEDLTINKRGIGLLKSAPMHSNNIKLNLSTDINKFYNEHLIEISKGEKELSEQFLVITNHLNNFEVFSSYAVNNFIKNFDTISKEVDTISKEVDTKSKEVDTKSKDISKEVDDITNGLINVIVEDPKLKNYLIWYSLLFQIYVEVISEYVNDAEMLILKIDNHVKEHS
jgi:hypothetical protein